MASGAVEIGTALIGLVKVPRPALLPDGSEADENTRKEMQYLRVFAVDFTVAMNFRGAPRGKQILDAFYGGLKDRLGDGDAAQAFWYKLKPRLLEFTKAVKQGHENGPAWSVGSVFAELCSPGPPGAVETMTGVEVFMDVAREVKALID